MPTDDYSNSPNMSRSEEIIQSILDGTEYDEPARSRIEYLLKELKSAIEEGGGGGGGSYTAGDGLSISGNTISVIPATAETIGGIIIGDGLEVDEEGVLSSPGSVKYIPGDGISITDAGSIDTDYYFDTQVSCNISGNRLTKTFTKYNTEPAFGAIVSVYTNESFTGPVFVGRTPDSVKYTDNTGNPQGTVVYRDKTWYYSTFNGWVDGERVDTLNNMQKIEGLFNIPAQTEDIIFAILDAAYDSSIVTEKEISVIPATTETIGGVIIGEGLSFDANGAIEVDGLSELQAKTVGMSTGGSNYIVVGGVPFYVSSTAPTGDIPDGSVGVGW